MSINELELKNFLESIIVNPLQLFSLDFKSARGHFLIEVCLDNLSDPRGSVSLKDCENVSRLLNEHLEVLHSEENYTLQVSSAGAERQLRVPEDLGRFKNVPVKISYFENEKKESKVFSILESDGVTLKLAPLEKKDMKTLGKVFELKIDKIIKGNLFLKI